MSMRTALKSLGVALGFCAGFCAAPAYASAYPQRPVTVVVGYAAGGATDAIARIVSQKLGEQLGQPFIVENRPGANGNIATEHVAKAPADGYTLLFGGSNNVTNSSLYKKLPFDFRADFVPIAMVTSLPNILVVHPSVPANSVAELIALARARPKELNFGSSGVGSSQHLSGELFKTMAGVEITHVPYKGSSPAVADLLGGHIQIMFDNAPSALGNVRAGKTRALGVSSIKRSAAAPDIPTISEAGLKGYDVTAWLAFFASAKISPDIAEKLNREVAKALALPQVRQKLLDLSTDPMEGDLQQIKAFVGLENAKWSKIVNDAGAKLD